MTRRSYGSGSLFVRTDAGGGEAWYGKWYSNGRRVKRKIGPKRRRGSSAGLTRAQAERELQRRVESERAVIRSDLTIESAGRLYLEHLEHVMERKPSTLGDYRSILRAHAVPFFGERRLNGIEAEHLRGYISAKKRAGLTTKTITNQLIFLHGLFGFAVKRGWLASNPVAGVDRPRAPEADPDIHYLELEEVESLLRAVATDYLGSTERALYLTAAMAGLRQGELLALRWRDIDWQARRIRVRRNYTRQIFGTPKSRRGSRSVPMIDRVASELERHFGASAYQGDDDLVFCHPHTGQPYDASKLRKRFKQALFRARLRSIRFHDLRHTFGTHCASAGAPMLALQEWMGHRDIKTTQIYADYAPRPYEAQLLEDAFDRSPASRLASAERAGDAVSAGEAPAAFGENAHNYRSVTDSRQVSQSQNRRRHRPHTIPPSRLPSEDGARRMDERALASL
jgi:integrase